MRICVIGTGYVGLITGVCFAEFGINVTCVDSDAKKIRSMEKAKVPFYEPGLEEMLRRNLDAGRISFTTNIADAVASSRVIFIAVGTPPRGDGAADMRHVEDVARGIAAHIKSYKVIVTKSTVPVGTGHRLMKIISKHLKESVDFDIVSNPEFLREGAGIEDFMRPNRVVIGASGEKAINMMKDLYKPLYLIETPFVITDVKTAELIKYASNAFLATKISFINEIANLCEKIDADVQVVAKAMGLDRRIGPKFLHAGPGYGGSCFPKDTKALLQIAKNGKVGLGVVEAVINANEHQKEMAVKRIKQAIRPLKGKTVCMLGLSFKPNTNDLRDAPSLYIIDKLLKAGAKVRAFDPVAVKDAKKIFPEITCCRDVYDAAKGADALVIVTEWNQFRNLDLDRIKRLLKGEFFFDLRNIYEPDKVRQHGFTYYSVGRP
ncbi:MAG TPA: UDP-glucose/GDP-mannose dehydrogenase family protein [Nitrospirae bacterium]|nr:UDP-glucose 6-dehydrogenase YwqF [bacterium BMS3Abin10]GBE37990.1 UDP-glucose 6-dehydrogenase YwqF [bacterium BMS3Bbin08]HDH51097.1 UDP-glucose/GDP-mannose dehydrogenase family protein [Nitrospirota bacterium]HDK16873.1 UDP-glucose/GDP-mannose dehydrogenase family protein [Nitrospirota bacterium]HDK81530.1 UDP-glucose/GDP-mannose dehydrogenase family protein [Nitrospirota bacterium]